MTGMMDKSLNEPKPFVPTYMVVNLTQINKRAYDEAMLKAQPWAKRPLGFIVESGDVRTLYINEEGKYYYGVLDSTQTTKMFMQRETRGVEVITRIVFTEVTR